jgi:hypothetical protein
MIPGARWQMLVKVGGRELPQQPDETRAQVLQRRGMLICLGNGRPTPRYVATVMPFMADM